MTEVKAELKEDKANISEETAQFVTFLVAEETYGVTVNKVQSINEMMEITHVPRSRSYIEGVINLRGSVVPVIDMRKKFNLLSRDYDSFTVILIVEVKERLVGMIADAVSDVVSIPVSCIERSVDFSARVDTSGLEGIGRMGEELIILLNVENFFESDKLKDQ